MAKTIEIFAGPNGSGKTTFGEKNYAKRKDVIYLNPDKIASGLSVNGGEISQFEAGRILFNKVEDCMKKNISFAFETTMSGKVWLSFIKTDILSVSSGTTCSTSSSFVPERR